MQNRKEMEDMKVKLLGHWASPVVMRVHIALKIKSISYEFQEENLGAKSDLLLKSNPVHKKIPVLIHGDFPISESLVILNYIDEVWSSHPAILPSHPIHRALARFWASYIDEKWFPAAREILLAENEELAKKADEAKEGTELLEEAFVEISKGEKFFGGGRIGYLDIALGCYLRWVRVINELRGVELINETETPSLFRWAQDFTSDAAVEDFMPETDKLRDKIVFLIGWMKAKRNWMDNQSLRISNYICK